VWGNWTRTWLSTLTNTVSTFNNYEIGGKYAISPALSAGLGYTFSQMSGQYDGRWNQINSALDYALSKTTDVYAVAVYQRASGRNYIDGKWVPVQAEIGSSTSFIGNSGAGARSQLALRIGLRHKF
jgi:predicted porin